MTKLDQMLRSGKAPEALIRKYLEGQVETPQLMIAGYVKWELVRKGKVIRDSGGFHPNVITTVGMNNITTDTIDNLVNAAAVGSGSNAPAFTDVALQTQVGTAVGRSGILANTYVAGPPDYWFRQHQYKFLEANANGNLTEFGTFKSGGNMFSRQLLKDGTGTPTTITKTSSDQLWITYEMRCYPPTADVVGVLTISAVNYDMTTRPMQVNGSNAWGAFLSVGLANTARVQSKEANNLLSRTAASDFGGASQDTVTLTPVAYVSGNFYLETQTVWDVSVSNYATGIGALAQFYGFNVGFGTNFQMFQHVFTTTKIPKTNTKKLTLFMRRSWARYP